MKDISEIDLPFVDILDRKIDADPFRCLDQARQHGWLARSPVGYVVLDYHGMKDLLSMDDRFRTPNRQVTKLMKAEGTAWGRWNDEFMLATSGEKHVRLRTLVAATFTPRNANRERPMMREVIGDLLDGWAPAGRFDFALFASNFPITVMCRLIGAPSTAVPEIKDWLEVMGSGFSLEPDLLPALDDAFRNLWAFVDRLMRGRSVGTKSAKGKRDLLDDLLEANVQGNRLSQQELYDLVILLFGAGYDTSKNLLTMIMYNMLARPEDWARLPEDRELAKAVIEETLRHSNIITTYRLATEDVVYRDLRIPKDTMLVFPLGYSGRDETVFHHANVFEPSRVPEEKHFGFGRGAHMCLGQFIARAQIEEALPLIAKRLRNPRLDGELEWRPFPGIWGLRHLPIAFDHEPVTS